MYAKLDDALELLAAKLGVQRMMPTDKECERASRDPMAWYKDVYRPSDPAWTRETPSECLRRTNPQAARAARRKGAT